MPIYGDLYKNLQWSLTFDLKVVTHLKSASEASYDVINMATIMKKVNKQCLLDTPRTVRVSEKTWQVIVRTRRP